MKFESMLARRYIFSQKRHSLLTICSIIIALALMVMLSSTFSTVLGIMRDYSYEIEPYHVMFEDVTKEQAAEIRHMNQVESVEIIENKGMGNSYQAQVMFSTYIDDDTAFFQNMIDHIGLNASYSPYGVPPEPEGFRINQNLMTYDQIDLKGKYAMTCTVAVFAMYLLLFAFALRLVIDTAFEVSSKERERQFGVLQSVGATPKQIVRIMTVEGMYLSLVGVPLGIGLGLLLSFAAYKMILATGIAEAFMTSAQIGKVVHFHIKPLLTALAGIVGIGWVFFSAYGTGMRVIRMTPVQAITARAKTVTKVKKHTLLSLFFGWKGKVASRNARRSRKRFAITVLSLTISMLLFATVSSVITMAEQILTEEMTEVMQYEDDLGTVKSDFEMWVDMKPDAVMQSPEDVAEGIKMLEDSGYFTNIQHNVSLTGGIHAENTKQSNENFLIYYVNRADYQRVAEKTDISYDELTASGGALMCGNRYALEKYQTDELKVDIQNHHEITREEYDKRYEKGLEILNEEKKEQSHDAEIFRFQVEMRGNCHHISQNRFDSENMENAVFYEILDETVTYPIIGTIDQYTEDEYAEMEAAGTLDALKQKTILYILLTEDTWRSGDWEKFGIWDKYWMSNINCQLAHDEDYEAAKAFLKDHSEIFGIFEGSYEEAPHHIIYDMYTPNKQIRTVFSAVHIGLMFLLVMVALIAVVNMVNIVSTGILNRKREFAAMQCSGMTRGQMYGIAAIECLQFALWAAIAASLLCGLLLFGTNAFMRSMDMSMKTKELMFLLSTPFIRIWIAAAVAFICAFAASVIPLRTMQKESLVEQIRAVE